uniref:titin isoform X2 n=1 Tax=Maylandia zebra TaxID=106582 RepID=UPI000D312C0E|nr:titin isoform X2 [Maylandia zebra]
MKLSMRFSVPLWTLLVFSAFLKSSQAQNISNCATGTLNITTTTTTADVTFQLDPNCSLTVGSNMSENSLITGLTPGAVYHIVLNCSGSCNVSNITTKPETVSLTVTNITTSSMFVSWTKPVGSSSFYKVQWTVGGTNFSVNVNVTSYTITNLTAGVQYEITVTAVADDNYTEGQSATVTIYTKPEKVNDLNVSEIRTSSIFLNWTEPQGQRSFYRVEWTDGTINMNKTVTETKVNVTELTPGANYTFTVIAVAGDNNTQSDVATLSQYTKPEKVNDLNVSEIRTSSIFLNWTEPQGQRSFYRVEWTDGTINMNKTVTETKVNVTELTPGVNYTFTVIAVAGDNSTQSDVATLSQYTKPEVVTSLSAVNVTTSSVFVSWTKPVGNSSFYKVQWTNFSVNVNVTSYTITNLTAGVQYEITVTAVADDNYTEGQNATVTIYTKPEKVNDLTVSEIRTSSIFLNWTEPQGQRSFYRVEWTDGTINMNKTVTETKVNVTELTPGVNYTFTVIAVAGDNNTQSDVATLSQYTKPEKVNDLNVSEIRTSSIFLNWTEPQGQRSFYRVEWTDGTINMNKTVTETKVNVTELTPGVNYTFTVIAVAGDNNTQSDVATLSQYTKPEVVTSLSAVNVTTSSVFVSWTKPVGNSSFYKVQWTVGGTSASVTVSDTFKNIINLTAGVQYEINVTAVAGDGSTKGQSATVTNYTKPEKVNDLTVSEIRTSSIFLNWTEPQGQRSFYRVEWTDGTINMNKTVTETKVNVTELTPGANYTFTVIAVAGDNNTQSDVATLSQYTKPEVVTSLSAVNVTTSSVFVSWTKPVGSSSFYKVQWTNFSVNVSDTFKSITNLTAGVQYEITVTAVADDNCTEGQNATVTIYTKPEKVNDLTVSEIRTSSIFLNWTEPQGQRSFYRVEWTDGTINMNKTVTETKVNVTELTPGANYTFTVIAVAGDNNTQSDVATLSQYTKPEVVTSLSAVNVTTSSVFVSWTKPVGSSSFYIVQWTNFSVNVSDTFKSITNLTAGVQYEITVTAVADDNCTEGQNATVTIYTKPEKVNDLTVSEIRTSSIFLNWTEPQGQRSFYRVEWTDGTINMNKTVTETKVNVTELTPGANYTFTVIAVAGDNNTQSDVATLSQYTKPEVVTSLSAVNVTTSSVFVSWTKPVGSSSFYIVQWTNFSVNVSDTFKSITNLTAGVQYEITVTAVAGDGSTEGQSATVTNYTKPEKVNDLTVSEIRTSSIFLNWTEPQGQRSFYRVEWTDGTINMNKTVTETKVNVTELTPGANYTFTVIAVAGDNNTQSDVATLSQYTKPEVVTSLSAVNVTTSSVFVSWTKPVGSSSFYKVQWTVGGTSASVTVSDTFKNIINLTAGVQYEITVTAVAGDGSTEGQSATVTNYTKPEKVNDLTVSEIRTSSIFLNWTEPQGQRSFYRVEWTDGTINMNKTVTETKVNVTELTPGVNYTFTVIAVAGDNNTQSDVATLSQYTKPEVVTSLSAVNVTTSSIFVSWTKPVGNSSFYKVQWTVGGTSASINVNETFYNIINLTAGVQYEITVTAVADDNCTEGQNATVTIYTKPEKVNDLTVSEIRMSSIFLNWTEPQGQRSFYRVEWTDGTINMNKTVTETKVNVTELTPGANYTFTVIAVAGDNNTQSDVATLSQYTKPEVVTSLSAVNVTTSSVFVSWTKPVGSSSFYIVQWTVGGTSASVTVSDTFKSITNLTAGVQYEITVTAVAGDGSTKGQSATVTNYTKPEKVNDLTVSEIRTSSIFLNWTEPQGQRSFYRVEWTDGTINMNKTVTETKVNVTELTPGVNYTFTVIAVAGDNNTQSDVATLSQYTKPEVVTSLSAVNVTTSSIFVSWTKPVGNSSFFKVQWTVGGTSASINVNETFYNIINLTAGVQYEITVTAVAGDGSTKGQSATVTNYTRPEKPGNISVTEGTNTLSISWILPRGNISYYQVKISNENLVFTNSSQTMATTTSFTYLKPGRLYNITVTAFAGNFWNTSDQVSFATVPKPPGSIIFSSRSNSSLQLQWATPDEMIGAPDIIYSITYQAVGGLSQNTTSTQNNTLLSLLDSGTNYTVTVKTTGPGNLSSTVVQNSSFTLPNPVRNLIVSLESTTSLNVNWSNPLGVKSYYIYLVDTYNDTGGLIYSTNITNNSISVPNLNPGTNYSVTVRTKAAEGSESTVEKGFSYTMPKPVTNITVESVTTTSIKLTWSRQNDYKPSYSYLVIARQSGSEIKNDSTKNETYTFYNLTSGELYTFSVFTVIAGVKSTEENTQSYTMPEAVSNITAVGTTTSLSVSWTLVTGKVSSYSVVLNSAGQLVNSTDVNNQTTNIVFVDLTPGVIYCVQLITKSGPFQSNSSPVCDATFPNPPGSITVQSQTVNSINFTWALPQNMNHNQYNFSVTTTNNTFVTKDNWFLLGNLPSGSPYNISVVTVGVTGYKSTSVTTVNYTRPFPVSNLTQTEITTNAVTLVWTQQESKLSYSYWVQVTNESNVTVNKLNVNITNATIRNLRSGSNFNFTVTTLTADGTQADPVTVSYFTRPYGITELEAETINTTAINLNWTKPAEYRADYKYRVATSGCAYKNNTLGQETIQISGLDPGTNCTFCVSVMAANGIEGQTVCTSQYTKPETVQPTISGHSNSSITVTWMKPKGNVERYSLYLTPNTTIQSLNSLNTSYQFENLSAGRAYSVMLTTISGPFNASSELVTNATLPNPPGTIEILNKTTSSIETQWTEAPLMTGANFYYRLTYTSSQQSNNTNTTNTRMNISSLSSGTSYNISVKTVGELEFQSEMVYVYMVTTRPLAVQELTATPGETHITVNWTNPPDYKNSYKYFLSWNQTNSQMQNCTVTQTMYNITNLEPGQCYSIYVTTETSDETRGAPVMITKCTNASPVTILGCQGPNDNTAQIILSCTTPHGQHTGFQMIVNGNNISATASCNYTISGLNHNTIYNVTVITLSHGNPSIPVYRECSTGIPITTIAVGVSVAVFLILFSVLIAFIIYWKRLAKKESPDIQIESLRAKVSVAVSVEDFEAYYKKQRADSNCGFAEEFEDLKVVGTAQSKLHALNVENKPKNRYNNVLPYDSSRVKLSILHGSPSDDYINANYMPGYNSRKEFIAAQGPLPTTVNDFWRMIWEKNVQTLVMLTRCNEQGRVKCEQYWSSGTKRCDNIIVKATSEITLEDWTLRDFDIKNVKTAETRAVRHFHFTAWPDHGVPETTELLISFRHLVREHMNQYSKHSPTVVHCSAGVGRTGTFIAIDRLIFQIERENTVDVFGIVHDLRMHRPLMVQTEDQYVFLNQCALDIIRSRTGTNVDLIYQNTAAIYENIGPKKGAPKNGYHNS